MSYIEFSVYVWVHFWVLTTFHSYPYIFEELKKVDNILNVRTSRHLQVVG